MSQSTLMQKRLDGKKVRERFVFSRNIQKHFTKNILKDFWRNINKVILIHFWKIFLSKRIFFDSRIFRVVANLTYSYDMWFNVKKPLLFYINTSFVFMFRCFSEPFVDDQIIDSYSMFQSPSCHIFFVFID